VVACHLTRQWSVVGFFWRPEDLVSGWVPDNHPNCSAQNIMRDQDRRRDVWAILDEREAEIAELRGQARNGGLMNLWDVAPGHLVFCRQILGNSTRVSNYPGVEDDEQRLFGAADLFVK